MNADSASQTPHTTTQLVVGGIPVTLLSPPGSQPVGPAAVCFFLHGRKESPAKYMDFCVDLVMAASKASTSTTTHTRPLPLHVAVFEQRNHGSRLANPLANDGWREGNSAHAIDMWAIQYGTSRDVSFLIDTLPLYLPPSISSVSLWAVAGVSLGGHATLLTVVHEPRVDIAVSVIGCGDYEALMVPRAIKNGLPVPPESYSAIPKPLLSLLATHDPVNAIHALGRQKLLLLSGGEDRLVPAAANERFVQLARDQYAAHGHGAWFDVVVEDGARHTFTPAMRDRTTDWILQWLLHASGSESRL
ncbi:Alpha/Beta hydrolase protein [Entophlyctis helioformis]|nr:Alpha/Beta hydrolase protein [Entophlyctis helioformis]